MVHCHLPSPDFHRLDWQPYGLRAKQAKEEQVAVPEKMFSFFIPFALFEHYLDPLGAPTGQVSRGNFFKCADESSHPEWASWSPVDRLDFHRPHCFGTIRFA
jgi:hypothetical protein